VRLTTYHHIVPMSRYLGALTLLHPSGPAWTLMGVLYLLLLSVTHATQQHVTYKEKCAQNGVIVNIHGFNIYINKFNTFNIYDVFY
jgi:hypothetical protein